MRQAGWIRPGVPGAGTIRGDQATLPATEPRRRCLRSVNRDSNPSATRMALQVREKKREYPCSFLTACSLQHASPGAWPCPLLTAAFRTVIIRLEPIMCGGNGMEGKLGAGRELDQRVHEVVVKGEGEAPAYSTDITAAWELFRKLPRPKRLQVDEGGAHHCLCGGSEQGADGRFEPIVWEQADKMAPAICLAALAWAERG
jgi:hypothetical protein